MKKSLTTVLGAALATALTISPSNVTAKNLRPCDLTIGGCPVIKTPKPKVIVKKENSGPREDVLVFNGKSYVIPEYSKEPGNVAQRIKRKAESLMTELPSNYEIYVNDIKVRDFNKDTLRYGKLDRVEYVPIVSTSQEPVQTKTPTIDSNSKYEPKTEYLLDLNGNSTLDRVTMKRTTKGIEVDKVFIDGKKTSMTGKQVVDVLLDRISPQYNANEIPGFWNSIKEIYTGDVNNIQQATFFTNSDVVPFLAYAMDPKEFSNLENPEKTKMYAMTAYTGLEKFKENIITLLKTRGFEQAKKYVETVEDRFLDERNTLGWAGFALNPLSSADYVANSYSFKTPNQDKVNQMTYVFGRLEQCINGEMPYDLQKAVTITPNGLKFTDENQLHNFTFGSNFAAGSPKAFWECIVKNAKPIVEDQMSWRLQ
jgi:hypothetical protein